MHVRVYVVLNTELEISQQYAVSGYIHNARAAAVAKRDSVDIAG
jgi:hypothetical protein